MVRVLRMSVGVPNVTPLPMGSKKFVSTQIIGISKRTYLVGG